MARPFSIRRVALALAVPLLLALALAWYYGLFRSPAGRTPSNAIVLLVPYRYGGTWVFDDASVGLVREPFVSGIPEMIDVFVKDIPGAENGFRLYFSAQPFPGHQKKLTWLHGDKQGNWYRLDDPPMEGWLCPALFRYYREAPKELYVKAEPKA